MASYNNWFHGLETHTSNSDALCHFGANLSLPGRPHIFNAPLFEYSAVNSFSNVTCSRFSRQSHHHLLKEIQPSLPWKNTSTQVAVMTPLTVF